MPTLHIRVDYFNPVSHALRSDGHPVWPPDPLRLQQTLNAGAHQPTRDAGALQAVAALGSLPAPVIYTSEHSVDLLPATYAPRSGSPVVGPQGASAGALKKYLDGDVAGISSGHRVLKPTSRVLLTDCTVVFVVEDQNSIVDAEALDRAARRVPYLGRSNDLCDITVSSVPGPLPPVAWHPVPSSGGRFRGWAPNSVEWMDANHELTSSGSELPPLHWGPYSASLDYRIGGQPRHRESAAPDESPMQIIPLRKSMPQGRSWKILQSLEPTGDVVRFPCVVAGFSTSDGGVRGFGLTGPTGQVAQTEAELRKLLGALAAAPDHITSMRALDPTYWQRGSTSWVSATPLRAFPNETVAEHVVVEQLRERGLECTELTLERKPARRWQLASAQPGDGLGLWWLTLKFAHPVSGPLMVGASTDAGFGLFVPEEDR